MMPTWLQRLLAPNLIERQLYPGLRIPVTFRTYAAADFARCLEIHDLNAPGRFPKNSHDAFVKYLADRTCGLIVVEHEGEIVGCGGLVSQGSHVHTLCYGLVHPRFQGRGIGSMLTLLRLQKIADEPGKHGVLICSVPRAIGFYGRFGFARVASWVADEEVLPVGMLAFDSRLFVRIGAVLRQRGHFVQGDFTAQRDDSAGLEVEHRWGRMRIKMRQKTPAPDKTKQPTGAGGPS